MLGRKIDWTQTAMLAGVITASVLVINWVFANVLKTVVQPLFATIQPVSAVTGTLGEKMLGLVSGIIPLGEIPMFGVVAMFLSAMAIVLIGELVIDSFKLPQFKSFLGINGRSGRIASIVLYGAVPVYAILVGFTLPAMSVIIGLAVHTVAVSVLSIYLADWLKIRI